MILYYFQLGAAVAESYDGKDGRPGGNDSVGGRWLFIYQQCGKITLWSTRRRLLLSADRTHGAPYTAWHWWIQREVNSEKCRPLNIQGAPESLPRQHWVEWNRRLQENVVEKTEKVKVKGPGTCYSAAYTSRLNFKTSSALHNLGSGSWSAWADDTAAHYAAIHCPR